MFTIRIKTKSTKTFSWISSSGSRAFCERTAPGLREAVIAAIIDFRDYAHGDGSRDELQACLVTWEDGEAFYAFIFPLLPREGEIPTDLPWTLMHTKPQRVTRASELG
jgi:hypothetical protein